MSHRNSMNHLKRQLPKCKDYQERRALKKKYQTRTRQKSNKGKLVRRKVDLAKFAVGHKEQMDDQKTGKLTEPVWR